MTRSILKAAGLAAAASLALAAPAAAAPGGNASATCTAMGNVVMEAPLTHGGCVSALASGQPRGGAFAAQCRNITQGKYPFTFYGTVTVRNPGECLNALRGFHTNGPPAPPA